MLTEPPSTVVLAKNEKIFTLSGGGPPTKICNKNGMNDITQPAIKHCPPNLLNERLFIEFYSLLTVVG